MSSPWSELRLVCSLREGGGGRLRTRCLDYGATSGAPGWKGLVWRHGQLAGCTAPRSPLLFLFGGPPSLRQRLHELCVDRT